MVRTFLQRSYKSAEIAFSNSNIPIIKDARLREYNYGDLTQHPSSEVDTEKLNRIAIPFPNGESYEMINKRMKEFLEDILKKYDGKTILIIGHRATQYVLESYIKGRDLKDILAEERYWKPGWEYEFTSI